MTKPLKLPAGYRTHKPSQEVSSALEALDLLCEHPEYKNTTTMGGMAMVSARALYDPALMEVQTRSQLFGSLDKIVEAALASLWRLSEARDVQNPTAKTAHTLPQAVDILTTAIQKDFAVEVQRILESKKPTRGG
jgi:hypothetical protein